MWENLLRVDWARLTHAYGWARDVPRILRNMVAPDEQTQKAGWDHFWGAVNHQGDFYDATVAAIPFLVAAVAEPQVADRAAILDYFRQRWLDAPIYGGDPMLAEPPGGVDVPTPLRSDADLTADAPALADTSAEAANEEFDISSYRPMDLCAWQTGRAILAGRPTFERLLNDPDREVAAAASILLLLWPETRRAGKRGLIRVIEHETDPVAQARWILEFAVYGERDDAATYAEWAAPQRPATVRAAAALAWAWVVNPAPLARAAAVALDDTSTPQSDAFARLPWVGVYHRGPWILPANAADVILRLTDNNDHELRWRAVQGLAPGRETVKHLTAAQVVPVLVRRLADPDNRVRAAASFALSRLGETILAIEPTAVSRLLRALDDTDSSACGHAARLLAAVSGHLTPAQRTQAVVAVERAARRFAGKSQCHVMFDSMWVQAAPFLKEQQAALRKPIEWNVPELLAAFFWCDKQDGRLPPEECDRRLAEAYARAPQQTIAVAMRAARAGQDRAGAIGAALWLMTLGPAAEPALEALDAMAAGKLDDYAREQARDAAAFIRRSLVVTPESHGHAESTGHTPSVRERLALLSRELDASAAPAPTHGALIPGLIDSLEHPDAYVRAGAATILAKMTMAAPAASLAIPILEKLLADDGFAEVGVTGTYRCAGRLYHWRKERRCPRASALEAMFALGQVPAGDRVLRAMLAESTHAAIVCGKTALPHQFLIAQWRSAVAAAGGLAIADPLIRAARQQCRRDAWSGQDTDCSGFACEAELAGVIGQLSGRLV